MQLLRDLCTLQLFVVRELLHCALTAYDEHHLLWAST